MDTKDSFGDDELLNDHFILSLYDPERRPFDTTDRLGHPLDSSLSVQEFLRRSGLNLKFNLRNTQEPHSELEEALRVHKNQLRIVQNAELARLERNTWGVHRAIAVLLRGSTLDDATKDLLTGVLIPEWREHLDDFVDRDNALVWFDMSVRRGTQFEQEHEQYMLDRKERIHNMVIFVVQWLHIVKEEVDHEMGRVPYKDCKSDLEGGPPERDTTLASLASGDLFGDDHWNDESFDSFDMLSTSSDRSLGSISLGSMESVGGSTTWDSGSDREFSSSEDHVHMLASGSINGPSFIFPKL